MKTVPVKSRKHSMCATPLSHLDWSNWWTDTMHSGEVYLHVANKNGETVHRVFPDHDGPVRLQMKRGNLHWIFD